ncbi:MAG: hypothetical protein KJO79_02935 [Verrucomicrobiae bacterium]|nr:hypothetical protein [Verrucomicrobiae bacterium]NNJ86110.1 hypothetical protein [Akkermansiaceae bacterium]
MAPKIQPYISKLTASHRVVLLGGLAVIAHGFSRNTKDVDIWLDPLDDARDWLAVILETNRAFEGLSIHSLPGWQELKGEELITNIESVGMVRILGLECPLDIFRIPNGLSASDFQRVWSSGSVMDDGTHLPTTVELLATKENTGRSRDFGDWNYLISKARQEQGHALAKARSVEEASSLLADYFDYEICERGLKNPHPEVRNIILEELKILAADGDPFAREILANHQ